MIVRTFLLACLLTILSLSGCTGDAGDGDAETERLDAPDGRRDGRGGGATAGAAGVAGNRTPVPTPFSWDGSVGHQAGACAVLVCTVASLFAPWDNSRHVTDLVGGELTMTWEVPYDLGLGLATRCENVHVVDSCSFVASTEGASPLTLDLDDPDPDRKHTLVVWHPYRGAPAAGVRAGAETAFHVEGTVVVV